MRILITGSGGMVGKNLVEQPGLKRHELLTPRRSELDLFRFDKVQAYMDKMKPDFIIHAAGRVGGIQANIKNPVEFLVQNLDINRNVIMAARNARVKQLLNLGSSCMYPRNAQNPLVEEMVLQGELEPTNEGYAIAKITAQRLCSYITKEDPSLQYKTIIPCNLYGKYDKFDQLNSHLVPAIIHKLHTAKIEKSNSVEIWGDGRARREFMYAGDLADCIHQMTENFESLPELMNVGLGFDYNINDYYKAAAEVIGYKGEFHHDLTKPVGMKQKLVSVEKLSKWGWESKTSLHEGIEKTYKYYLNL